MRFFQQKSRCLKRYFGCQATLYTLVNASILPSFYQLFTIYKLRKICYTKSDFTTIRIAIFGEVLPYDGRTFLLSENKKRAMSITDTALFSYSNIVIIVHVVVDTFKNGKQ